MNTQYLSIAGFVIKLQSESSAELTLEEGYSPFIISDYTDKPDVIINAINGIPNYLLEKNNLLFEAKNEEQNFFSIYRQDTSYKIIIFDQKNINEVQQIAILNNELTEWKVYCKEDYTNKITPLLYPLGPIVMYYLTVKFDAIMLHASGVFDNETGRIFSGFSGVGKSTMSAIWQKTGSKIINDDRLIIRKNNKGYTMHNTPMFYVDIPKVAPLNSIYLIHHSAENTIKKLNGALAVSRIMAHCIQHGYNNNFIQHHLEFLSHLCNNISVYDVGFKPDISIVNFIKEHATAIHF
ncbi:MAG: hypothetical protein HGB12_08060 [Bacteroidetes bacterium]|nr:hypothetical protein [Bacteroidota bacterium]